MRHVSKQGEQVHLIDCSNRARSPAGKVQSQIDCTETVGRCGFTHEMLDDMRIFRTDRMSI